MTDSGVARTVRQRGAMMAGAGYTIQFISIVVLVAKPVLNATAFFILFILLALLVGRSLKTYSYGLKKGGGYDRRKVRMSFRWLQGSFAVVYLVLAVPLMFPAGRDFDLGASGPTVLYLIGAASSYLGNETLVSAAKSQDGR